MASAGAQTVTYSYNNGTGDIVDRAKIAWPDGYFVSYSYDAVGHMTTVIDSDPQTLATRTYDNLGRAATVQYPNSTDNIGYTWTAEDDMLTLANNLAGGAANDVTYTNTFTPAHQINSATISNAAFKYSVSTSGTDSYAAPNGLNQYTSMTPAGGSAPPANGHDCAGHAEAISYDCAGNLAGDGTLTLTYDPENRLMTAGKTGMSASYLYDPLGRRTTKTVNGTATNFLHDGDTEIGEYDTSGNIQRRFVPGPVIDQSIAMVTCTGAGCAGSTATKTMFHVDKLGSVVAMSKATNGQLAPTADRISTTHMETARRADHLARRREHRTSTQASASILRQDSTITAPAATRQRLEGSVRQMRSDTRTTSTGMTMPETTRLTKLIQAGCISVTARTPVAPKSRPRCKI